jgi:hypothetical protein
MMARRCQERELVPEIERPKFRVILLGPLLSRRFHQIHVRRVWEAEDAKCFLGKADERHELFRQADKHQDKYERVDQAPRDRVDGKGTHRNSHSEPYLILGGVVFVTMSTYTSLPVACLIFHG